MQQNTPTKMVEMPNLSATRELCKDVLQVTILLQKQCVCSTFLSFYKELSAYIYIHSLIYSSLTNSFISNTSSPHFKKKKKDIWDFQSRRQNSRTMSSPPLTITTKPQLTAEQPSKKETGT